MTVDDLTVAGGGGCSVCLGSACLEVDRRWVVGCSFRGRFLLEAPGSGAPPSCASGGGGTSCSRWAVCLEDLLVFFTRLGVFAPISRRELVNIESCSEDLEGTEDGGWGGVSAFRFDNEEGAEFTPLIYFVDLGVTIEVEAVRC